MPRQYPSRLAGLVVFLSLSSLTACGIIGRGVENGYGKLADGALTNPGRIGPLSDQEKTWAHVAWHYVVSNTSAQTGLVNGSDQHAQASAWDMGDYLAALVAARELGEIDRLEFDHRLSRLLAFLGRMNLSQGKAPNSFYNTGSGAMSDVNNQPADVGWSAIDIGRLMTWLRIVGQRYPQYREYTDKAVMRWNFCALVGSDGVLYSGRPGPDGFHLVAEGRLGDEQYAAAGFAAWGFDTHGSMAPHDQAQANVLDHELTYDTRDPRATGMNASLTTLPYVLGGLEYGWKSLPGTSPQEAATFAAQARNIYELQELRWQQKAVYTARADHSVGYGPYWVDDTIFANGYAWNTLDGGGTDHPELALLSTRAVFGMWELWDTNYTKALMKVTRFMFDPERGWFEGRYEASGGYEETVTLHTNAMVLEALLYKTHGHLFREDQQRSYFQTSVNTVFDRPGQGLPAERDSCSESQ